MGEMRAHHARGRRRTSGQTTLQGVDRSTSPSLPPVAQRWFCGRAAPVGQRCAEAATILVGGYRVGLFAMTNLVRTPFTALVRALTSSWGPFCALIVA